MRSIFDEYEVTFERKDNSNLTISQNGVKLEGSENDICRSFEDIDLITALRYDSSNRHYELLGIKCNAIDNSKSDMIHLDTDLEANDDTHNIFETKTILTAFAANKLGKDFPNNLDSLDMPIGLTMKGKVVRVCNGEIIGDKDKIALKDIEKIQCTSSVGLTSLFVYTKNKKKFLFFNMPNMRIPGNVLTLYILEAAVTRNTGKGIDFSKGNGFDQKTSEYIICRYLDSDLFADPNGNDTEWQNIVKTRVAGYQWDLRDYLPNIPVKLSPASNNR